MFHAESSVQYIQMIISDKSSSTWVEKQLTFAMTTTSKEELARGMILRSIMVRQSFSISERALIASPLRFLQWNLMTIMFPVSFASIFKRGSLEELSLDSKEASSSFIRTADSTGPSMILSSRDFTFVTSSLR